MATRIASTNGGRVSGSGWRSWKSEVLDETRQQLCLKARLEQQRNNCNYGEDNVE